MSSANEFLVWVCGGLVTVMTAIIGWIVNRQAARIDKIEEEYVPRADFDKIVQQLQADKAHFYEKNEAALRRIEEKIDSNEERSAKARHETLDTIHQLALKLAVADAKLLKARRSR